MSWKRFWVGVSHHTVFPFKRIQLLVTWSDLSSALWWLELFLHKYRHLLWRHQLFSCGFEQWSRWELHLPWECSCPCDHCREWKIQSYHAMHYKNMLSLKKTFMMCAWMHPFTHLSTCLFIHGVESFFSICYTGSSRLTSSSWNRICKGAFQVYKLPLKQALLKVRAVVPKLFSFPRPLGNCWWPWQTLIFLPVSATVKQWATCYVISNCILTDMLRTT